MAEVIWTEEAHSWLRDIHEYISADNPKAAVAVCSGIFQKAQILVDFPEIGYLYRSEPEGEIRILLYGHYRIAYLFCPASAPVILGIFHGALDLDRYFP